MPCAQLVVDFPERWADQLYTYDVPEGLDLQPGWAVMVPFGETELRAYVVEILKEKPADVKFELRSILHKLGTEPVWLPEMIDLARWISDLYACTLVDAFQVVVPPTVVRRLLDPPKPRARRAQDPGLGEESVQHRLTEAQQSALLEIGRPHGETLLLEGITGSGKTEVYLSALERVLAQGKTAIALVPEVSLTPQAIDRYRGRLGDQVALLHSRLSEAERTAQWRSLQQGKARLALGTRSAVFAPLTDLGLIIVDEEHDHSYKQDSSPRYHARQVASWRARRHGCSLLLGSATPCVESYYLARQGRYRHLRLEQRATSGGLPPVEVIDLRKHRLKGRDDLSAPLCRALQATLDASAQAVILYNRRGYARYLQCQDCGKVMECPNCSISLTLHRQPSVIRCHYCDYHRSPPDYCLECGGFSLRDSGSGTQRLFEELQSKFPAARVLRMDRDTTKGATGHRDVLRSFAQGDADILVGTQMVSKGLDFPRVTLVGVVGADHGLHVPDFRAAERVMQMLVQVAGRSGRGQNPGRVLLQALDSENPVFGFVRRHDYSGFLRDELELRRELGYPPFCRLGRLVISGSDSTQVVASVRHLSQWLSQNAAGLQVLGPSACPLEKLHGMFRWHFLLKGRRVKELSEILRNALRHCKRGSNVRWVADVDPQSIL